MNYTTELKEWGSTGEEYPTGYAQEDGVPPIDKWHNFLFDNAIKDIQHLISVTNDDLLKREGGSFLSDADIGQYRLRGDAGDIEFDGTEIGIEGDIDAKQTVRIRGESTFNSNVSVDGNITVSDTSTIDGVDISGLKLDYDSHESDTTNPHGVTESQTGAASSLTSHEDSTGDVHGIAGTDSVAGISDVNDAETSANNYTDQEISSTETWVDNNYNNYTFSESHNDLTNVGSSDHHPRYSDSEARSAVDGATLSTLNLGRDGLQASDAWMEIDGGSNGLLIEYYNQQEVRIGNGSAEVSINDGAPVISASQGNEGYEIQKNGTDGNGIINFKT